MNDKTKANESWPFEEALSDEKIVYQGKLFTNHPLFQLLGFTQAHYEYGYARFDLPWRENLSNYGLDMHGGMHATMIDTATAQAIFTGLKRGYRLTTVHLDVRYFRPFLRAHEALVVEAHVRKWGRTLCHAEAVLTAGDETIAVGSTIYAVIEAARRQKS